MGTICLSREQVHDLCPECAVEMAVHNITTLKLKVVDPSSSENPSFQFFDKSDAEVKAYAGFSKGLCKRFGEDEGFFTRCAETMAGKVEDEKGFCASLHKFCVGKWPGEKSKKHEEGSSVKTLEQGVDQFIHDAPEEAKKPMRRMFDDILQETECREALNKMVWALNDSIQSILQDKTIVAKQRESVMADSLDQFITAVKEKLPKLAKATSFTEVETKIKEYAAKKRDVKMEDGVWRTVNGRRVFIAEGESIDVAMKRSLVGDTAKTSKEHRAASSYHAVMAKKAAQAGDKALASKHEVAIERHLDAMESPSKLTSAKANLASDEAHHVEETQSASFADAQAKSEQDNKIKGVEIFDIGQHNGDDFTEADLDTMVEAFKELDYRPALKIGHSQDQVGSPAFGYVTNLRRIGSKLVADFESMHDTVVEAIRKQLYDRVSSEIYFNLQRAGKTFKRALKAVALLGAEVPAVAKLLPLHKMEFAESGFEAIHACELGLEVPVETLLGTYSERVAGLVNLIKEFDMAKNAKTIAELKTQVGEFNKKMEEMMKKKGKKHDEMMDDDDEYKQLAISVKGVADKIATLEKEDQGEDEVAQLRQELAQRKSADEKAEKERVEMTARLAKLEQTERDIRLGEKVKACSIPAFRPGLNALYAYALDNSEAKVKVFSKDKDGKDMSEEKTLTVIIDGFVTEMNKQAEKLFKSLAYSGTVQRPEGDESDDASKAVNDRVMKYKHDHPEVKSYEAAMKAVLAADPELAQKYRSQLGREQ